MQLSFRKGGRKPNVLTITRSDGSSTYVKFKPPMELHDLAHYAVEKIIGQSAGFYWMVDKGFSPSDFEKPKPQRPPGLIQLMDDPNNMAIEFIVNQLMVETMNSGPSDDFEQLLIDSISEKGAGMYTFDLTTDIVAQMRRLYFDIIQKWRQLPESESLQLLL